MALVYPLNKNYISQDFIISPNTSSFINIEGKAVIKEIKSDNNSLSLELELFHKNGERKSKMFVGSNLESVIFLKPLIKMSLHFQMNGI